MLDVRSLHLKVGSGAISVSSTFSVSEMSSLTAMSNKVYVSHTPHGTPKVSRFYWSNNGRGPHNNCICRR